MQQTERRSSSAGPGSPCRSLMCTAVDDESFMGKTRAKGRTITGCPLHAPSASRRRCPRASRLWQPGESGATCKQLNSRSKRSLLRVPGAPPLRARCGSFLQAELPPSQYPSFRGSGALLNQTRSSGGSQAGTRCCGDVCSWTFSLCP